MTITASHTKHHKAQQLIQPYSHIIYEWAITNNFHINTDENYHHTFSTPDPAKYGRTPSLKFNKPNTNNNKTPKNSWNHS